MLESSPEPKIPVSWYPGTLHSHMYPIFQPLGKYQRQKETHSFFQVLLIWIIIWCVPQDFSKKQRVFHQTASWNIQEIPEI